MTELRAELRNLAIAAALLAVGAIVLRYLLREAPRFAPLDPPPQPPRPLTFLRFPDGSRQVVDGYPLPPASA